MRKDPPRTNGSANRPEGEPGTLSDEELDGLSSLPEEGGPTAAGGAQPGHAQRSWIVKDSEQETPDSQGP